MNTAGERPAVAVIGAGPAGLMAAEVLAEAGARVDVYDAMASAGRKFLLAGRGGLNLTHSEPRDAFLGRYGARQQQLSPVLSAFDAEALCAWCHGLGIDTFVGSSGRVFPREMKAAPLLRAWMHRLREAGVRFHMRHRWLGWNGAAAAGQLRFSGTAGELHVQPAATLLALGGASWKRLGSDGAWLPWLAEAGIAVAPLRPANCGFDAPWSDYFRDRFAGQPVKAVIASCLDADGRMLRRQGEFVVTGQGVEGSLIYALSAPLRDAIDASGSATIWLDLAPGRDLARVQSDVAYPRGSRSLSSHLQSRVGIHGVKAALLRELLTREEHADSARLAAAIKSLPLRLTAARPIDEAISSAGGVRFDALDEHYMLRRLPGVFCAGEMLDWEAPTGGYLLTACMASGRHAGKSAWRWLKEREMT
jgi:uncharacterized flavoprotein (TIGR03862 family)